MAQAHSRGQNWALRHAIWVCQQDTRQGRKPETDNDKVTIVMFAAYADGPMHPKGRFGVAPLRRVDFATVNRLFSTRCSIRRKEGR